MSLETAKTRSDLTPEEIAALPDDHPWKHESVFTFEGAIISMPSKEEAAFVAEQERQEELERKREKLLAHYRSDKSGVPERYQHESLDTYNGWNDETKAALAKVRSFVKSSGGRALVMCGTCGTGKTHLGCGIIRERGGIYRTMLRLVYEVDGTMSFKAKESKIQLLDRFCFAPMLVLDEIGRTHCREDVQLELASYLVSERYANNKPTVLITNLEKMKFVEWFGMAVKDRLNETGEVIEFKCESFRPKKRATFLKG